MESGRAIGALPQARRLEHILLNGSFRFWGPAGLQIALALPKSGPKGPVTDLFVARQGPRGPSANQKIRTNPSEHALPLFGPADPKLFLTRPQSGPFGPPFLLPSGPCRARFWGPAGPRGGGGGPPPSPPLGYVPASNDLLFLLA